MKNDDYTSPEALESILDSRGIVGCQPGAESALEEARRGAGAGKPGKDSGDIAHPPHYQAKNDPQGIYECIKVIEAWDLNFCLGNALKYISRAGRKPGEDAKVALGKAVWYLQRETGDSRRPVSELLELLEHAKEELDKNRLEMANAILTADRDAWRAKAEEKAAEEKAEPSVTDFDKTCPEVKPGQVWQHGPGVCGRHEYIINEKTLGKVNGQWQNGVTYYRAVNGQWQNGVTYYRADQFGPRLFWREIEDFHSDFQFVREEQ